MKSDGSFSGETNGLKIPMNKATCCDSCRTTFAECIYGRPCACTCHTAKTTLNEDLWEKEYAQIWEDAGLPGYAKDCEADVKRYFTRILRETRNAAYAEGARDGEGTKNGAQRYLMGYADGLREALGVARTLKVTMWNVAADEAAKEKIHEIVGMCKLQIVDALTALLQVKDGNETP